MIPRSAQLFLVLTLFGLACGGPSRPVPEAPNLNAGRYQNLLREGARDLSCSEDQLGYSYQGNDLHRLSGCGGTTEYFLYCPAACAWMPSPRRDAAFTLNCPEEQMTVVKLGENKVGVSGCGQRATFIAVCQGWQCSWVQNAGTAGAAPAPSPQY